MRKKADLSTYLLARDGRKLKGVRSKAASCSMESTRPGWLVTVRMAARVEV